MRQAARVGRLGMLAVGLGLGAALASTPEIASADPSTDPLSWVDQVVSGISIPADTASPLDMQISISGIDLFSTVDNTATATSGFGSFAVAIGDGADANASGGLLDFVFADGTDSTADAGLAGNFDVALANGDHSTAGAGLAGNFDVAIANGANRTGKT